MQAHITWIDVFIVIAYLLLLVGIGIFFSRRQRNLEEYFLAGRNMSWLPVGLSLMGAIHSGIQYIQGPSVAIKYGLIFLMGMTSWLVVLPWVTFVILPFYQKLGSFTCYEYLEKRFGRGVRALAAFIFLLWRVGWIATALYVPALAVHSVTGGKIPLVPMIVLIGTVVTVSTTMGGMRAVIWTDVLQFVIMIGGLALTVAMVIWNVPGGMPTIFKTAYSAGKLSLFAPIPSASRISGWSEAKFLLTASTSFIGIPIATTIGRLANYSTDQVMIQRFQTTRSLSDSRRALFINAISNVIWTAVLAFVGISLFAYISKVKVISPGTPPDAIFPQFMATAFPTGTLGFVIAAIFAASLATIGSAINACSSVALLDFNIGRRSEPRQVRSNSLTASRWLTLFFGFGGTLIATQLSRLGDLVEISNRVIQTFTGPLFGIFVLGMFTRQAHQLGVLIGGLIGTAVAIYLAFFTSVGFIWPYVYGLLVTLAGGYVTSIALRELAADGALTWKRVMGRAHPSELRQTIAIGDSESR